MPGLNQRGPMNEGPMTGGGRGMCRRQNTDAGRGQGRGCGRQGNRGGRMAEPAADPPRVAPADPGAALRDRAGRLEAELAAVKRQLKDLPAQPQD